MIILGIDPGFAIVGYGVIKSERGNFSVIDYGVIETSKNFTTPERLLKVNEGLVALLEKFKPDCVAVEELFFTTNQKTAIKVAEARGIILLNAMKYCGKIYEYTPLQIKQAMTGYGKAEKKQIQMMVKMLLKLKEIPKPDDAADALAVALCCGQTNNLSSLFHTT